MKSSQQARKPPPRLATVPLESTTRRRPSTLPGDFLSSILIDGPLGGLGTCEHFSGRQEEPNEQPDRVSIDILPVDVLLHVFDFCRLDSMNPVNRTWGWHRLVHICQRWRRVILASCLFLDLRLVCTERTPVRKTLDVWPPLPIMIEYRHVPGARSQPDYRDLIVALGQCDRIYRLTLCGLTDPLLGTIASVLQEPFPALTYLRLESFSGMTPTILNGFMGGHASSLQRIWLGGIQFTALPQLLSSASGLVELRLNKIPGTRCNSPETMATCLSNLTKLVFLSIEFQSPHPHSPDHARHGPPPLKRAILPALTVLFFKGVSEYLEDLVAQIDAPRLEYTSIRFFNQLIFEISEVPKFIARTDKLKSLNRAEVFFDGQAVGIGFYLPETTVSRNVTLRILSCQSDWQLSSLAQVCNQSLPLLSSVEQLDIRECPSRGSHWQDKMQWVDLFLPFTAVTSLHIPKELGQRIAPVLQELTEPRAAEVLPALRSLVFEELEPSGCLQGAIEQFIAARELSGHPVDVRRWDAKWERDVQWEWGLALEWEQDLKVDNTILCH